MTNRTPVRREDSLATPERLEGRLENLKSQLENFTVKDTEGRAIGTLQDLKVGGDGLLNILVSGLDTQHETRLFTIASHQIQKIEYASQSVFVILSAEQIKHLPDYEIAHSPEVDPSYLPGNWSDRTESIDRPSPVMNREHREQEGIYHMDNVERLDRHASSEAFTQHKEVIAQEIQLLEERLVVDRTKRKVGEVVVRKEVETRIIEVPVRREKLIVEQVTPEYKELAQIDLGKGQVTHENTGDAIVQMEPTISGTFDSPETAARIIATIAKQQPHGCTRVRVEIVLENEEYLNNYQQWFERYSID